MSTEQIVTITMNPTIDKSAMVDTIIPEAKLKCSQVKNEPGGGGINVSKALNRLGMGSFAVFPAGGHNGNLLQDLLSNENILFRALAVTPETRENFIILETTTNNQFRFNIEATSLSEKDADRLMDILKELPVKPTLLVASGSLPGGIPENFYAGLAKWAATIHAKFILDTSGAPLRLSVNESVYLLKPNLSELARLSGKDKLSKEDAVTAAKQLISNGDITMIVVSMGAEGAVLVTRENHDFVTAPKVKKLSTVGAGDSMVAGMVYMLSQNASPAEMIRFGVACGTAATMNTGTELFHVADVNKLYDQLKAIL